MADYIPSRDVILKLIRSEALTGSQLRGRFNITKKHKLAFKAVLAEMVEEGILSRNAKKEYLPAKARTD